MEADQDERVDWTSNFDLFTFKMAAVNYFDEGQVI